jgi:hypothetical protein
VERRFIRANPEPLRMSEIELESGSFRDRNARVYYDGERVVRGLGQHAAQEWDQLSVTRFFPRLLSDRKVVATRRVDDASFTTPDGRQWSLFLEHERIPFVSYPYEWSFSMLKDAALLQLELVEAALAEGVILKDSSPFNVQWFGSSPVFIDVVSFERLRPGEPWVGYRQFCRLFLYPLLLEAYKGVPFRPWLRGSLDGIDAQHCRSLMSLRDLLRPGVFTHVYLQSKLQQRYAAADVDVKAKLRDSGFDKQLIQNNVRRLTKVIGSLRWHPGGSEWSDYADQHGYDERDFADKTAFIRDVVGTRRWKMTWDLGSNTGVFSRMAAEGSDYVVAMDADPLAIDRLYASLQSEGQRTIHPLVVNLADPSPDLGWGGCERKSLRHRGKPELTLCLALIHHAVITANIPLAEFIDWLAGLESALVIEFVTRDDAMVQKLLRNKRDDYTDYTQSSFETCLNRSFRIVKQQTMRSGTRVLYFAEPRSQ